MTDHPEYLAGLRAVCAEPDEDHYRLILADWLDEHGEGARAEFIRVQCQIERWGCSFKQTPEQPGWKHQCGTDDRGYWLCQPLRSRVRGLLSDAHFFNWTPSVLHTGPGAGIRYEGDDGTVWLAGKGLVSAEFCRGFVSAVTLTAAGWLAHADALYWHPGQTCPNGCTPIRNVPSCPICHGAGFRPFPPTAQPLREVRLTTHPDPTNPGWSDLLGIAADGSPTFRVMGEVVTLPPELRDRGPVHLFDARWPGITFHLPPEPHPFPPVLTLTALCAVVTPQTLNRIVGTVNAAPFRSYPARSLHCTSIHGDNIADGRWRLAYTFARAPGHILAAAPGAYEAVDFNEHFPPPGGTEETA